jgi:hypothetical protein
VIEEQITEEIHKLLELRPSSTSQEEGLSIAEKTLKALNTMNSKL